MEHHGVEQPTPTGISRRAIAKLGVASALSMALAPVMAKDDYPNRPIRLIVPFPPGGATDRVARLIGQTMGEEMGQPFVVENKAGAGATIGAESTARAKPDGYTIMYTTAGVHVINPAIYPKLSYDPLTSWTMLGTLVTAPLALAVRADAPFQTVQELLDYAKKNPGKLTYASAGNGSSLHQSGEMFKHATGVDILHVPYRGAGPAVTDLRAGMVDMIFSYVDSLLPSIKDGSLRVLVIGTPKRLAILPDLPTVAEITHQADYDADTWTGLVAPANLPPALQARLQSAAMHALEKHKKFLLENGYVILGETGAQMHQRIERELTTVTPLLSQLMATSK
ncbi:tripartite tricarboxylate transporter substrate binding protein [Lampropedia puyangensis]|uniref:Tripartite tricarboxylate transporter substrate binding protein n=1 Tax=Lampropedia puyangensis TaxID=1330072 RepID=A0A4S8ENH3_9BURK|nr:tripartite tricarboxylate transporter substrate binding protein [Lampropedia puyangensis]THT96289.1 tripartite tricarboxylate transporter substrate binding protein [Lampropedia puyangensis]